jgi:hypothetical protein
MILIQNIVAYFLFLLYEKLDDLDINGGIEKQVNSCDTFSFIFY